MPEKKRKTWLWILGWILCFPIPLTILMLRNKKLPNGVRYGVIAAAWLFVIIIGVFGRPSEKTSTVVEEPTKQEQADTGKQSKSNEKTDEGQGESSKEVVEEAPSEAAKLITDDTLRSFVQAYEGITGTELDNVRKVGTQGYEATSAGHTINMTYNAANSTIEIENNGSFEDMRQIFRDAANALDPSLGDNAYALFDEGVAKMSPEEDYYITGDLFNICFSAPNEFESGHIQLIVQK